MFGRSNPWVKLNKTVNGEPAGTVGILVGPAQMLNKTIRSVKDTKTPRTVPIPGFSEVHLVHTASGTRSVPKTIEGSTVMVEEGFRGGDTRAVVMVADTDYDLVTDRNDVPADRLATYDKDWQPRAAQVVKS